MKFYVFTILDRMNYASRFIDRGVRTMDFILAVTKDVKSNETAAAGWNAAYSEALPFWPEILLRSKAALPIGLTTEEAEAFIASTATKGGVTEAMVSAVRSGLSLPDAFCAGLIRCRQLAQET